MPRSAAFSTSALFTVKNHLQRIFKKLDVFNRVQAASKFKREHGVTNA